MLENLNIVVEESKKREVVDPEYLLKYDKIEFKNGDRYVVTEASSEGVELMLETRKRIKKEDIPKFLEGMSLLVRADCFEIG